MTPIDFDPDPAPDAADRALEADLRELLGGEEPADPYPQLARMVADGARPARSARWSLAALALLGAGVVFAIGWSLGRQPGGGERPAQDPAPPRIEYCASLDELADVAADAQGLAVVGMTDGEWHRLARFRGLRTLALLRGTPTPATDWDDPEVDMLSDAVWERLAAFPRLERFQLSLGGRVTGEGAAALGRLPLLRSVEIHGTRLSVEGCAALAGLASVQRLHLTACGLTDEHVERLEGARGIRDLSLRDNVVTPAGLAQMAARLPELRSLDLAGMAVGAEVLRAAIRGGTLEVLDLARCKGVTAEGLGVLAGSSLRTLKLEGARLDPEAEARLADLRFEVVR